MNVVRYINNQKIKGAMPPLFVKNRVILEVFPVKEDEKVIEVVKKTRKSKV